MTIGNNLCLYEDLQSLSEIIIRKDVQDFGRINSYLYMVPAGIGLSVFPLFYTMGCN